jgi:nucleotide-binding universal stress UspA family protein
VTGEAPQIVVGFDQSEASAEALRVATRLATRLAAELHVLHVVDLGDYPVDPDRSDWEEQADRTLRGHRERVAQLLADWSGPWTYHAERGDSPARRLSALADDLDALFIVVGTRGGGLGSAVQRLIDGSVTRGLVHGHSRPVLVVPRPPLTHVSDRPTGR